MRRRKMDEERDRRLEQSSKAYEKWRENSRNKPKPATQGLLRTLNNNTKIISKRDKKNVNIIYI